MGCREQRTVHNAHCTEPPRHHHGTTVHLVGPANCTHLNAPPGCRASSPEKGPQEHGAVLLSSDTRSWQDEQVSQGQPAETTKVQSPLTHQTEERPPPSAPQTLAGSSCTAISILSTTMDTRTSCMRMHNVVQRGPGLTSTSSSGSGMMMSNVQVRWRQSKSLHFFVLCFWMVFDSNCIGVAEQSRYTRTRRTARTTPRSRLVPLVLVTALW